MARDAEMEKKITSLRTWRRVAAWPPPSPTTTKTYAGAAALPWSGGRSVAHPPPPRCEARTRDLVAGHLPSLKACSTPKSRSSARTGVSRGRSGTVDRCTYWIFCIFFFFLTLDPVPCISAFLEKIAICNGQIRPSTFKLSINFHFKVIHILMLILYSILI